ncbi:MAG: glucose-1-phosphate adenylyltransferase, partial [Synergistaceae bacterium]
AQWPIRTVSYSDPPGFTYPVDNHSCSVDGCLRAEASRVLGAYVRKSVLSRNCVIKPGAVVEECIIGQNVEIGENCRLRRVIVDAHNIIPPGTSIGFDPAEDAKNYHVDKASGIVVVEMPKIQLRKQLQMPGTYNEMFKSSDGSDF